MRSRGPIILTLELMQALTAICAVTALILALTSISQRIDAVQQSRKAAAEDTCYILRRLVVEAYSPRYSNQALTVLDAVGLRDCKSYARLTLRLR